MTSPAIPSPKGCPLCQSPHTNFARDLKGDVQEAFCKVCGCHAPIAAWNRRSSSSREEVRREALEKAYRQLLSASRGGVTPQELAAAAREVHAALSQGE